MHEMGLGSVRYGPICNNICRWFNTCLGQHDDQTALCLCDGQRESLGCREGWQVETKTDEGGRGKGRGQGVCVCAHAYAFALAFCEVAHSSSIEIVESTKHKGICVHARMHVCACMHECACARAHFHTRVRTCLCESTRTPASVPVRACVCAHGRLLACFLARVCQCVRACTVSPRVHL